MFVEVEAFFFALFRDAQGSGRLDRVHQRQRHDKGRNGDDSIAENLRFQHRPTAAIEESLQPGRSGVGAEPLRK